jgi:hypothetical protein
MVTQLPPSRGFVDLHDATDAEEDCPFVLISRIEEKEVHAVD